MYAAPAAIPPKPKIAATTAIKRNVSDHRIISFGFKLKLILSVELRISCQPEYKAVEAFLRMIDVH